MFDGKDTITETKRKDDALRRRQRSSKMHNSALRWINFQTMSGLSFEHCRAKGSQATEVALTEEHGGKQHALPNKAPFEQWRNHVKDHKDRVVLTYWTAIDSVKSKFDMLTAEVPPTVSIDATGPVSHVPIGTDPLLVNIDNWFDHRLELCKADKKLSE